MEFGLPPNILEVTDISQLLSLVVARECLRADAGYGAERGHDFERTGVILGVCRRAEADHSARSRACSTRSGSRCCAAAGFRGADRQAIVEKIKLAYIRWEENSFPGLLGNVIAGRIANRFDLGGINCVVDAACAQSPRRAVQMAVSELIEGRCDMMITGGVDTDNSHLHVHVLQQDAGLLAGVRPAPVRRRRRRDDGGRGAWACSCSSGWTTPSATATGSTR